MPWIRINIVLILFFLSLSLQGQTLRDGLYQTNPQLDSAGRQRELESRFNEQRFQTRLGYGFAKCYKAFNLGGKVREISYRDGTTVVETSGNWTAFTMSSFIIGGKDLENDICNKTYQHEYGHYLQSQELGPYYVMLIAIPSILSKVIKKGDHHFSPTEQDANRRAYQYFQLYYPSEIEWDIEANPLPGDDFQSIAPDRFDRIAYDLNPIIGTIVGGIVNSF